MANLSDKYISNIERATSVMNVDVLMKICNVLQTTPDYIPLDTTTNHSPANYDEYIKQTLSKMTPKQIQLTLNFMDWLTTQNI